MSLLPFLWIAVTLADIKSSGILTVSTELLNTCVRGPKKLFSSTRRIRGWSRSFAVDLLMYSCCRFSCTWSNYGMLFSCWWVIAELKWFFSVLALSLLVVTAMVFSGPMLSLTILLSLAYEYRGFRSSLYRFLQCLISFAFFLLYNFKHLSISDIFCIWFIIIVRFFLQKCFFFRPLHRNLLWISIGKLLMMLYRHVNCINKWTLVNYF